MSLPRLLHLLGSRGIPTFVFGLMAVLNVAAIGDGGGAGRLAYHILSGSLWAMFAVLVNVRPAPLRRGRSAVGVLAALSAQFAFIGLGLLARDAAGGVAVFASDALLLCGMLFAVASVAVLGRCFGVLPDVRGLVTRGPYRLVRHPVYLGELAAALGLAVGSRRVVLALGAWCLCVVVQLVRTRYEEDGLRAEFPEYETYAERTPRLIPGLCVGSPACDRAVRQPDLLECAQGAVPARAAGARLRAAGGADRPSSP